MKAQRQGNIVNCASQTALVGFPGYASYIMAKEAIRGLTRSAATEWAKYGIVTNCFLPVCRTDAAAANPGDIEATEAVMPGGYFGYPEDVAPIVAFMASEQAHYMNGQFICMDGGWRMIF